MARLAARLVVLGALVVVCAIAPAAAKADLLPGLLGGNCGATTQAFAAVDGDGRSYYFATNGGFESGSYGWSLGYGAKVVAGNEPYYLHSRSDDSSLLLPSGGSATSPQLCFGTLYPGVRFMASSPSGSATIRVRILTRNLLGVLSVLDGGSFTVGKSWQASPVMGTLLSQLTLPLGTKTIQVQLLVSGGSAQIDDVFVDPLFQDC